MVMAGYGSALAFTFLRLLMPLVRLPSTRHAEEEELMMLAPAVRAGRDLTLIFTPGVLSVPSPQLLCLGV